MAKTYLVQQVSNSFLNSTIFYIYISAKSLPLLFLSLYLSIYLSVYLSIFILFFSKESTPFFLKELIFSYQRVFHSFNLPFCFSLKIRLFFILPLSFLNSYLSSYFILLYYPPLIPLPHISLCLSRPLFLSLCLY